MLQEREEYNQVNRSFVDSDSEDENSQKDSFRLRFLENVGQGSFGKIKKAVDLVDNQFCAVKVLK
jgi:serine/threonine protein kinase